QLSERDGARQPFFGGVFGIFGHGNVAGIGQALHQSRGPLRYYQCRNEQAMVHTAAAFAKATNRLRTLACTTSIGPGATNMITGAAGATINRLPVLLLPGDIFAGRGPAPVLQQLESAQSQDVSVNDCFRPVSRYWDRIYRAEQLLTALPEAMRVLTSPSETGAVTLALPQDTQTEAFEYPDAFFESRVWAIARQRGDASGIARAAAALRSSTSPLIVAGGGVLYSDASSALQRFADATGIAVAETQAGKSAIPSNHPLSVGAIGVTGTLAANRLAHDADLVIAIGTRLADFTTMSNTGFANPDVQFIGINVCEMDAFKRHAIPVIADARSAIDELRAAVNGYTTDARYRQTVATLRNEWNAEIDRVCEPGKDRLTQAAIIGAVNAFAGDRDVVVAAAGSVPGDLHKLWRSREPNTYHLEYGYSCMGYEIAGGLGVKMADPSREVIVMVGDGSYLMMAQEIVTSVQEGHKLIIVLLDSSGYASIGGLSRSIGSAGFGTQFDYKVPIDLAANAESLGAVVHRTADITAFEAALQLARTAARTTVIYAPIDTSEAVPAYESWWNVPIAEVSEQPAVEAARREWESRTRRK
ncbi:MAG TPA: 3D-(3,5/4)-trihydroxycyclohexane-1,2-dione acylhydrolase (decyclizing), partial [Vicinamibacterales bacterium]|nr:3D-(3,5/4)-trihydroxycyclohexane-1,2-dione acylhydrolase (decyclizing) [Vicinamibacterales bacterium]